MLTKFSVNFFRIIFVLCATNKISAEDNFFANFVEVTKPPPVDFGAIPKCGEGEQRGRFMCVPYYNCDPDTNTVVGYSEADGTNIIIPRIGVKKDPECGHYLEVCCQIVNGTGTIIQHPPTAELSFEPQCGIQKNGEFPWMVALFYSQSSETHSPLCGGSLLSPVVVLTAAHCVSNFKPDEIRVRAGQRFQFQERNVVEILTYKYYFKTVLYNDVALLILNSSFEKDDNVGTICIPTEPIKPDTCFVTGWSRQRNVLRKIEISKIYDSKACERILQTKLGRGYILHRSFICASGVNSKTCQGDGGSPLVCSDSSQRYYQIGIVSWGIGCEPDSIPDVYTNVVQFRSWIDTNLVELGYNSKSYTP